MTNSVPLAIGSFVGNRFILEEQIGHGDLGAVFRARDVRKEETRASHSHVAIKILSEEFERHPNAVRALLREARKAQGLAHPNIVTVHDVGRDGSGVHMTMELLEGDSLDRVIERVEGVGVGLEEALRIIRDVCDAVSYAHEHGILHTDFKPANVFLTRQGIVKVLDFGIARAVRRGDWVDSLLTLFDSGALNGLSPAYAGYEVTEGKEPDVRDDLYAIACVFYELLTGNHPFARHSAEEASKANLRPLRPAKLSRSQWRVLRNALEYRRDRRPASVLQFAQGLAPKPNALMVYFGLAAAAGVAIVGVLAAMQLMSNRGHAVNAARAPANTSKAESVTPSLRDSTTPERRATILADTAARTGPTQRRANLVPTLVDRDHSSAVMLDARLERLGSLRGVGSSAETRSHNDGRRSLQAKAPVNARARAPLAVGAKHSRKRTSAASVISTSVKQPHKLQHAISPPLSAPPPDALSQIAALKQRLLAQAGSNQVYEAVATLNALHALREDASADGASFVKEAQQAIALSYVRLASDSAKNGRIEEALNLANTGSHIAPGLREAIDARNRYLSYSQIDEVLRNRERISTHNVRFKIWRVSKLAPDEMPAITQRWANDLANRVRVADDPKLAAHLSRVGRAIFGSDSSVEASAEPITAEASSSF